MGRSKRTLDRRALRADNEAAERIKGDDELEEAADEEEDEDEEDESDEAEAEGEGEGESESEDEGGDDEEAEVKPKKKKAPAKPKAKPKAKAPAKPRTRTAKVTRMRVVWVIYNNSHQQVEEFDYPKKKEAEEALTRLQSERKTG